MPEGKGNIIYCWGKRERRGLNQKSPPSSFFSSPPFSISPFPRGLPNPYFPPQIKKKKCFIRVASAQHEAGSAGEGGKGRERKKGLHFSKAKYLPTIYLTQNRKDRSFENNLKGNDTNSIFFSGYRCAPNSRGFFCLRLRAACATRSKERERRRRKRKKKNDALFPTRKSTRGKEKREKAMPQYKFPVFVVGRGGQFGKVAAAEKKGAGDVSTLVSLSLSLCLSVSTLLEMNGCPGDSFPPARHPTAVPTGLKDRRHCSTVSGQKGPHSTPFPKKYSKISVNFRILTPLRFQKAE